MIILRLVTDYLAAAAEKWPGKIAVVDEVRQMTYGELWREAERIGAFLASRMEKKAPVALWFGLEGRSIAASQGIVLAGLPYAPLDISMPKKRLAKIFGTLEASAIITNRVCSEDVKKFAATLPQVPEVYTYEDMTEVKPSGAELAILDRVESVRTEDDALSIIFTSGSTGSPKGVISSHRMLTACTQWQVKALHMDETTVRAAQSPLYFAMGAYLDVYATIAAGGELHLLPKSLFLFKRKLISELARRKINLIFWVPSVMRSIVESKALALEELPPLRTIAFCGEPMPPQILAEWFKAFPRATFSNHYGSTEVTIAAWQELDRDTVLSMGKPCGEKELVIVTEDGSQAAPGEVGEILVRGPVAVGYLGDRERTEEAFGVEERTGKRFFHTGDLARIDENGDMVYVSRSDAQVKHMGYRIELGEIESAALTIEGLSAGVCLFDKEKDELVLFYVADDALRGKDILRQLSDSLPRYMWPARLKKLEAMPQTEGGKIDRRALKEMF